MRRQTTAALLTALALFAPELGESSERAEAQSPPDGVEAESDGRAEAEGAASESAGAASESEGSAQAASEGRTEADGRADAEGRAEATSPGRADAEGRAASASRAAAQASLPWSDVAPRIVGEVAEVAALGMPDERIGSWPARRESARRRGLERARAQLTAWLDEQLLGASPRVAADVHSALRDAVEAHAVRGLADGAAVVVARAKLAPLRAAWGEGAPW